ncbi:MAG TPA: hypothetical protein VFA60_09510 [Terriglobales bacterium]|nr:hypothetical protein [Terriglobales bacterium]
MKKALFTLALTSLFALSMMAQTSAPPSAPSTSDQNPPAAQQPNPSPGHTQSKPESDQAKPQSDQSSSMQTMEHKDHKGKTMTGCLSGPNADGAYTLTAKNGKTVEIGGNDALKDHVGHEVKITATASTAAAMGETAEKKEGKEKHYKVEDVQMISESCTSAKGK